MFYLTELGNRLREEREAKGLSLEDLQEATKIQKRYLIGIEEGNYDMMPGKFYVRAFIKQYCEAVGLDSEEIFDQYKNDIPVVYTEELPEKLSRVKTRQTVSSGNSRFADLFPKILVGVFVIGAAVLIYILIAMYVNNSKDDEKQVEPNENVGYQESDTLKKKEQEKKEEAPADNGKDTEQPEEKEETPAEEPKQELASVSTSGKSSTYQLKNTDKFSLKIASKGETWVNIKNQNGKSLFQGLLKNGQSRDLDFTNESGALLVIGNAADTDIFVNDQKLEYAIPPTKTVTQNVTIQFVKPE
ncbi:helix-turn-helix domain-containing protein [Peribacillus sp. SCS-155]|uniref:helix-turn-helix domain-containing protein n=1 Tax=Peribacillus sedimenti TaxID=3115297 RepID=UPI0039061337